MAIEKVRALLEDRGLRNVKEELLTEIVNKQFCHISGEDSVVEAVFQYLLNQDIAEVVKCGTFPYSLSHVSSGIVPGKYLVQLEDIIDIASEEPRRRKPNATLKCTLFDGEQEVYGLELTDLKQCLSVETPAGSKLVLMDPIVHRGIILLTPETCLFLGGNVLSVQQERDRRIGEIMQKSKYSGRESFLNAKHDDTVPVGQGIADVLNVDDDEEEDAS
eukprot:jgi/Galph1/1803/GphlegSOOS_G494.1